MRHTNLDGILSPDESEDENTSKAKVGKVFRKTKQDVKSYNAEANSDDETSGSEDTAIIKSRDPKIKLSSGYETPDESDDEHNIEPCTSKAKHIIQPIETNEEAMRTIGEILDCMADPYCL